MSLRLNRVIKLSILYILNSNITSIEVLFIDIYFIKLFKISIILSSIDS